ncbi:BaiN/RdsA family NAD(P)/FAD-dependent oxidoreductase [Methanobrevibacter filiformis]|uniref:Ferredoxin--NADP reductase n=1 Tax=Methanobrevibacter filiformis TaxID=55758 RepID=A0A166AMJ2_9EURY|nr:aminoacetone oxidase family FAD-binding enzyme [Methanobrevibacter filiformis]KZX12231.1 ferredoxin--NADP reductase [Methanobrevibacter filiformis]
MKKYKHYKIAIIGGGPAGIMGAIKASSNLNPHEVILIEKNEDLGKKLLLTGGGRCNITNNQPIKEQLNEISHKNFLKHSFHTLTNDKLIAIFKKKGLDFKIENNKIYPKTDDSNSILKILKEYLKENKVDILLNNPVNYVEKEEETETFKIGTKSGIITSEKVIIATGGITYPQTGSTGEGHKIAIDFNHKLSKIHPGLIPLKSNESWLSKLSGITLEDVKITFKAKKNKIHENNLNQITIRGNVLISHFGLTGPGIIDLSNEILKIVDYKINVIDVVSNCSIDENKDKDHYNENNDQINKKENNKHVFSNAEISLDLIPNYSDNDLKNKLNEDFQKHGKKQIKNYMKLYLKNRMIEEFLRIANVNCDKTLNNMNKKDKNNLIANLKSFKIKITGVMPYKTGMITCGGIETKDINPKTMESKIVNNLFFTGEVLEHYGPSGGYNLQIAFSTGYLGGKSASENNNE